MLLRKSVWMFTLVVLMVLAAVSFGQQVPDPPECPMPDTQPRMPGTVEGVGTFFEITDSPYLNVFVETGSPVRLALSSEPEVITIMIESADGSASTDVTVGGLLPGATWYKYQDDLTSHVALAADDQGRFSYTQNLSQRRLVMIQPRPSTRFIPADTTIGTWDPVTRIYTLTTDVTETIQVDENNLTFDGNGHTVGAAGVSFAIALYGRTGVTVRNVLAQGAYTGIILYNCSGNTITNNVFSGHSRGVGVIASTNNTIANNVMRNSTNGIYLSAAWVAMSNNVVTDNLLDSNYYGLYIDGDNYNQFHHNTVINSGDANLYMKESTANVFTNNALSGGLYNLMVYGSVPARWDHQIDPSNTVEGKPLYYVYGASNQVFDASTNAGVFIAAYCDGITVRDLATVDHNMYGVLLYQTSNSRVENVTAYGAKGAGIGVEWGANNTVANCTLWDLTVGVRGYESASLLVTGNTISNSNSGIWLYYCDSNSVTRNSLLGNRVAGINSMYAAGSITDNVFTNNNIGVWFYDASGSVATGNIVSGGIGGMQLSYSDNCSFTGNTFRSARQGVTIGYGNYNQFYNNNFISNIYHAVVSASLGNVFSLPRPAGGNYWSGWTQPDADSDGIVDLPYVFIGGQDDLPWTREDGWLALPPDLMLTRLSGFIGDKVTAGLIAPELQQSFLAKIQSAFDALARGNPNDAKVAMNDLKALINQVEAQTDKKIDLAVAAEIIAQANRIIAAIEAL